MGKLLRKWWWRKHQADAALRLPGRWWTTVLLLVNSRLRIIRLGSLTCSFAIFHGDVRSIFQLLPWKTQVPSGSCELAAGQAHLGSGAGALWGRKGRSPDVPPARCSHCRHCQRFLKEKPEPSYNKQVSKQTRRNNMSVVVLPSRH